MHYYLEESLVSLSKNRRALLLVLLISLFSTIEFPTNKLINTALFLVECALIVVVYVHIMGTVAGNEFLGKKYMTYLPRFSGLFLYFLLAVTVIVVPEAIIVKKIYGVSTNDPVYKEALSYMSLFSVSILLCPFYSYSPAFVVLRNCFVYEAIDQGYRFILEKPMARLTPSLFITCAGGILLIFDPYQYVFRYVKFVFVYFLLFSGVNLAATIFADSKNAYVSKKETLEAQFEKTGQKRKFFMVVRNQSNKKK
jgi:hypothetical protein